MRFVSVKTADQQACLMLHRSRILFIRQQTAMITPSGRIWPSTGVVARVGRGGVKELLEIAANTTRSASLTWLGNVCWP
jgi:transposase